VRPGAAAPDRAGTRARGAAPPAGHGPIRAPKLGAGVLDAVLHAARRARPPGPARPPRRRVPSRHGHERFRVSAGQAARRVRLGGGRRIFRRRRALGLVIRESRRARAPMSRTTRRMHACSNGSAWHANPRGALVRPKFDFSQCLANHNETWDASLGKHPDRPPGGLLSPDKIYNILVKGPFFRK